MSDANVIEVAVRPPSSFPSTPPLVPPAPPVVVPAVAPATPAVAPVVVPAVPAVPAVPDVPPAPASFEPAKPPPTPVAPAVGEVQVEYTSTGDKGLDLALGFVGGLGFGPERDDMKAAMSGDFTKLEATLKGLGDKAKGWERYVDVAKDSYQRVVSTRKAAEAKVTTAVTTAAGGQAAWNAIHAWVQATADESEKAEINAAMKASPYAAQAMAKHLADLFRQSGQSELPAKSAVKENASSVPTVSGGALTPAAFKDEIRRLEGKFGYRLQDSDEYKQAVARRMQFKPQQ